MLKDIDKAVYDEIKKAEQSQDMLEFYLNIRDIYRENKDDLKENDNVYLYDNKANEIRVMYDEEHPEMVISTDAEDLIVVSNQDSINEDYHVLCDYETMWKEDNIKIGNKFPEAMRDMLRDMNEGQMIVTGKGNSFVCTEKEDNSITLVNNYNIDNQNDLLGRNSVIYLDLKSDRSLQDLYDYSKNDSTGTVIMHVADIEPAEQYLREQESSLSKGDSKTVDNVLDLKIKESYLGGNITWKSPQGDMDRENMKYAITWLENAPVRTRFLHKEEGVVQNNLLDDLVKKELEKMYENGKYEDAYHFLNDFTVSQNGDVAVAVESFRSENIGTHELENFAFTEEGVYVSRYNYEQEEYSVKNATPEEFKDFCTEKFDNTIFLYNEKEFSMLNKLEPEMNAFKEEIHGIAENRNSEKMKEIDRNMLNNNLNAYLKGYKELGEFIKNSEEYTKIPDTLNDKLTKAREAKMDMELLREEQSLEKEIEDR